MKKRVVGGRGTTSRTGDEATSKDEATVRRYRRTRLGGKAQVKRRAREGDRKRCVRRREGDGGESLELALLIAQWLSGKYANYGISHTTDRYLFRVFYSIVSI